MQTTLARNPRAWYNQKRMRRIILTRHAIEQAGERGTNEREIRKAIRQGEKAAAKKGRVAYRLNFPFGRTWGERSYATKQVMAVTADEPHAIVVVTVYVFYF